MMASTSSFSENGGSSTTTQLSEPSRFDQFTPFPKLPLELRLKIWNLALPRGFSGDGVRVLCVEAVPQCLVAEEPATCKFRFVTAQQRFARRDVGCYPPHALGEPPNPRKVIRTEFEADGADLMDVRLLKVCYESCIVFKQAFPYFILVDASEYGHIRFNHQTILNVTNILSDHVQDWVLKAKDLKHELPSFKEVRCLAIDDKTFDQRIPSALGLSLFGGLECLKVSTVPFTRLDKTCDICHTSNESIRARHVGNIEMHQRRLVSFLEEFASDTSLDFKLPKVEFSQH